MLPISVTLSLCTCQGRVVPGCVVRLWLQDAWPCVCCPEQESCFFMGSRCYLRRWLYPVRSLRRSYPYFILHCTGSVSASRRGEKGGGAAGWGDVCGGVAGGPQGPPGRRKSSYCPPENLQIPKPPAPSSGVRKSSSSGSGKMLSMTYSESIRSGINRYHSDQGLNQPPARAHRPGWAAETPGAESCCSD